MNVDRADRIAIVSGLPRSGTSMMMRMLEAGGLPALTDNLRVADEDNPRGYYEFEPVKKTKEDPTWLQTANGRVVKMVYRLLYDLPTDRKYDIIFMRRRLEEVVASQDVMLARKGKEGGALPHDKLVGLFKQQLDEFDRWVRAQAHFRILYVSYNDIMQNARPIVLEVNTFLGGKLNVDAMSAIVEPGLYRQRAE